ncbi:MAG: citrate/2-methylcitrate synthase [Lentisphaerae bacterium]|nr:citrate/2-methylcitrate synthase [Lentisphaerota bacterium]MBT4817524.1 citrate/2-methylcitrate synthase [Lentisphaerota bacterium]MBT5604989.1 citrate/2-methylcitrate synthase [Lentisphaerota bacterium]MBT7054619.1 citrate/2-methylcitrate synthase [Lentisphaerota bacterium]MBT7844648.1 citrate/2-methylcitrate synthase [Lentisphaerota bacterium]
MSDDTYSKGLEGIIAAETKIARIDGESGKLYYRGYSIQDLAQASDYEETSYLLLHERLPSATELQTFRDSMRGSRALAPEIVSMIRNFPPDGAPMELLQSVLSYLSGYVAHKIQHSATCNCRSTLHQVAQLPTVLAAYQRCREGAAPVEPRTDLSHGANFLYMLRGEAPDAYEGEIMDRCFVLHAEHGFNASTFTARVVASTHSTCYCSISAAIGALYGALHGGANARVLDMFDEIGGIDRIEEWLDQAFATKRKVMGMGHRVYKAKDPRAVIMEADLTELCERKKDDHLQVFIRTFEKAFRRRMETKGKPIYPNVDFLSGAVYSMLGIPRDLFTPIFAVARSVGWLAHILEQRQDNRIYRPRGLYQGPEPRDYTPVADR